MGLFERFHLYLGDFIVKIDLFITIYLLRSHFKLANRRYEILLELASFSDTKFVCTRSHSRSVNDAAKI